MDTQGHLDDPARDTAGVEEHLIPGKLGRGRRSRPLGAVVAGVSPVRYLVKLPGKTWSPIAGTLRLIQGGVIDLVRHLLSCNDQPSIKIAE